jgi:multiple sugar transport system substrate-binding protein
MVEVQGLSSMVSRRSVLKAAGAAAGAVALAGCSGRRGGSSGSGSSTLQMTFWGEGDQNTKLLAAISLFQTKNSNIKVQSQYSGLTGYYDKLATRLAGGNPPDIFQIHLPYLLEYSRRGVVRQLDDHVADLGLSTIPSYIATTSKLDGHYYYALVGAATQPAVVYDKTRLDTYHLAVPQASWTFADFHTTMQQVASVSGGKLFGAADLGGSPIVLESYLRGLNKPLFGEDGKLAFTQDDFAQWLGVWDGLRKDKSCVPMALTSANKGFDTDPLTLGKCAYTFTATSRGLSAMQSLNKEPLDLLPSPSPTATSKPGTNIVPAGWFAISAKSRNVDAAVALLKFLATDVEAGKTMGMARGVPIMATMRNAIQSSLQGTDKIVFNNYQQIVATDVAPLQAYPPGASNLLGTSLVNANESVGYAKATIAQAAAAFFADAGKLLK